MTDTRITTGPLSAPASTAPGRAPAADPAAPDQPPAAGANPAAPNLGQDTGVKPNTRSATLGLPGSAPKPGAPAAPPLSPEGRQLYDKLGAGNQALKDNVDSFLKDGGDPKVAESLLKQINDPDGAINQIDGSTCAAATAQKELAKSDPAQYFKNASEIIKDGKTQLKNDPSDPATLSDANRAYVDQLYNDGKINEEEKRDLQIQSALMDYANGSEAKYDLKTDTSVNPNGTTTNGLAPWMSERLNNAALGATTVDPTKLESDVNARMEAAPGLTKEEAVNQSIREQYEQAKNEGKTGLFVHLDSGDQGEVDGVKNANRHMAEVTNIDGDGNVTIRDGQGADRTMTGEEFSRQVAMGGTDYDSDGHQKH
ncbi:MAG: hypothetical protein JWM80_6450 [Cyanobacteria bacterium RYN_339]|nr:hypothetical protein [Cyanobacteria bacterium RYN_339]